MLRHSVHQLCELLRLGHVFDRHIHECPVPPGRLRTRSNAIYVPPTMPLGLYSTRISVWNDNHTQEMLCLDWDVHIRR